MNKFLLASTALVLSAGFAAAEVTVGGDGRLGIVYFDDGSDDDRNDFTFNSRIRISFTASGETDGGLQFGGSIRADNAGSTDVSVEGDPNADDGFIATTEGGGVNGLAGSVFISGAFGKLTMGDIDGAAQNAVGQVDGVGYTGIGDLNEIGYITGGDDEGALYEYSFGAATFYASIGQTDFGIDSSDELSVGVKYDAGTFYVAAGYETEEIGDHIVLGGGASFAGIDLKATYGMFEGDEGGDFNQYAVSGTGTFAGASVTAFYSANDIDGALCEDGCYGIGAAYDLGGGASLKGGISSASSADDQLAADFGVTLSF